jgi:triosephosphate isomerase (TIM)
VKTNFLVANWKMNKSFKDGSITVNSISKKIKNTYKKKFIILPSDPSILFIKKNLAVNSVLLGGQNCSAYNKGAYTGETSAEMLKKVGCNYVLIGHSERRTYHKETNKNLSKKVNMAEFSKLKVIFCIGESISDYLNKRSIGKLKSQLTNIFDANFNFKNLIIAYEPVWAIGTNKIPQLKEISKIHTFIKTYFYKNYNVTDIPVLYGGSVNSANSREIFSIDTVNGGLIGGASLNASEFCKIYDTL